MVKSAAFFLALVCVFATRSNAQEAGSSTPPLTYELMINGESFLIEANSQMKLQSQQNPGTSYNVALRIAMEQPVRLNTVQFKYDWPAKVEDDQKRPRRTVNIRHELGFSMLITDLGQPLAEESKEDVLQFLKDSTVESFQQSAMEKMTVGDPHAHKFAAAAGYGVTIRYQDSKGNGQTCLIYLMTGPSFAGSCIVQFLDANEEQVLPLVKKILDSVSGIE